MAEGLANLVIGNLSASVSEKAKLLQHLHSEAQRLKYDVESLQSFLQSTKASDKDLVSKTCMKRAREAVYDAEDVLEDYHLHFDEDNNDDSGGVFGLVHKRAQGIEIASEIQEVRGKIREIKIPKRRRREKGSNNLKNSNEAFDPRLDALFIEESELVGIDMPRNHLIQVLSCAEQSLLTVSVVGMGGLGKTTLVKKIYEQAKQCDPFEFETYAWIPVSQTFKGTNLLHKMITLFHKAKREQAPPGVDALEEMELIDMLLDYLRSKRFLLVLDDVWSVNAWKSLRRALPDCKHGSRVIITTRSGQVADFCCDKPSDQIYNLLPLDPSKAWSLFCRKAFRSDEENCCPPGLQKLAESFVKKCGGLPLAIVSLGSILFTKPHIEWEMIHRSLGSEFETNDYLKSMKKILLISVDDLPHYLRSCFLLLSIFPEDYRIKRTKLIRLWIAEGLIQCQRGRSLEEVADGYLKQLIQRSLIQVAQWKNFETVKTCQLHDMVREIIIPIYEEEGFFSSSSVELETIPLNSVMRRLSICRKDEVIRRYEKLTRLRSMFIFGVDNSLAIASLDKLRFLRVVDVENVPLENFPNELTNLQHLRYLSLENTKIKKLPDSVRKLKHLETLNLKGSSIHELPAVILQLRRLRHLLVYKYGQGIFPFQITAGVRVPAGIEKLRFLQKLGHVEARSDVVAELGNLTELRRLCVIKLKREDGDHFCASIAKMRHLRVLDVTSIEEDVALELQSLSCPPLSLQRLYLYGRMESPPRWICSLHNLVSVRLAWCKFKDDPLKALQSLTNLVLLELINAYDGEELCCDAGGYLKLKELYLEDLVGLKQVKVDSGAMSNLVYFRVGNCELFDKVPLWFQHITTMKQLLVWDMPEKFEQSLYKDAEKELLVDCVQHIRCIRIYKDSKNMSISKSQDFSKGFQEEGKSNDTFLSTSPYFCL